MHALPTAEWNPTYAMSVVTREARAPTVGHTRATRGGPAGSHGRCLGWGSGCLPFSVSHGHSTGNAASPLGSGPHGPKGTQDGGRGRGTALDRLADKGRAQATTSVTHKAPRSTHPRPCDSPTLNILIARCRPVEHESLQPCRICGVRRNLPPLGRGSKHVARGPHSGFTASNTQFFVFYFLCMAWPHRS